MMPPEFAAEHRTPPDARLTPEQAADCLKLNPFDMDFGSPGDRVLRDRICTARTSGECHTCPEAIQPGTQQRRQDAIYDDAMRSYRWCFACCQAMALSWRDGGKALDARYALRRGEEHG